MIPHDFVPKIHVFDTLDSTNTKARELAMKGASEGTVIVARQQSSGRGRMKRVWHSPLGGLYLSILLYPQDVKRVTDLSLVAGVALAQAVKDSLPKSKDISVKWPNDCLVGWKKVGGILSETLGEECFNLCVVGIGLNVNLSAEELAPYAGNPFSATSFVAETAGEFSLETVQATLIRKLLNVYRLYQEEGYQPIHFLWERNCGLVGKKVELRDSGWRDQTPDKGTEVGVTVGTFLGIDDRGAIVLSNAKGERHTYLSGEITCFWP